MKVYIHTIPKAGTYLLADYLGRMGLSNTGFHIEQNAYLDTKRFSLSENATTPSKTSVPQFFIQTLRGLRTSEFAFGHLPVPICAWALSDYRFVCSYRDPRKTLLSEFIDFRFRRDDVAFVSRSRIEDDKAAFVTYLQEHGPIHMSVFSEMLASATLFADPLFDSYDPAHAIFLNFDRFLRDAEPAKLIARHLRLDVSKAEQAWKDALTTETKTKATDMIIDRAAFWTNAAERAAAELGLAVYTERAQRLGFEI